MARQLRAIALLPGTMAVIVPAVILLLTGSDVGWGLGGVAELLPVLAGLALIATGLSLWIWTVLLFARIGEGTLAPWTRPGGWSSRAPTATSATG